MTGTSLAKATITVADVRRDPLAANGAFLAGATLQLPYAEAFEVWHTMTGVDLSGGLKAELMFAGQQLLAEGGSATLGPAQLEQLRPSLLVPVPGRPDVQAATPMVIAGVVAAAVAVVAVGFGVGFAYGYYNGDQSGSIKVDNKGGGSVTVTRGGDDQ